MAEEVKEAVDTHKCLDTIEHALLQADVVSLPLVHTFTPGLYRREIFMPAGTLCTSRIHNTEHPFAVMSGVVHVFMTEGGEIQTLEAGHSGVTYPGTRRMLYIEQDCRWATFHPLSEEEEELRAGGAGEEELVKVVEDRITDWRELPGTGKSAFESYQEVLSHKALSLGE